VSFFDWLLALHLLAAFALAAALTLFVVMVFVSRRLQTLEQARVLFRLAPVGAILITTGSLVVLLSFDGDGLHIYDGWIIAAILLWLALGGVGQRTGAYYSDIEKRAKSSEPGTEADVLARLRAPIGMTLNLATCGVFVLLLLDMIFKPGA
jgi:hypothetical protein